MARKKKRMVRVVARSGADLEALVKSDNPLRIACGNIGTLIAKQVVEGKGSAVLPQADLLPALDTQQGVNEILDHFDLYDAMTERPLLFALIRETKSKSP